MDVWIPILRDCKETVNYKFKPISPKNNRLSHILSQSVGVCSRDYTFLLHRIRPFVIVCTF